MGVTVGASGSPTRNIALTWSIPGPPASKKKPPGWGLSGALMVCDRFTLRVQRLALSSGVFTVNCSSSPLDPYGPPAGETIHRCDGGV